MKTYLSRIYICFFSSFVLLSAACNTDEHNLLSPDPIASTALLSDTIASSFSKDGAWVLLRAHTEGSGIPVAIMGDGFTNDDIESGHYMSLMDSVSEAIFSIEPFISFKSLFDVYAVVAVSETRGIPVHSADTVPHPTALQCSHGGGTLLAGNHQKCYDYIQSIPGVLTPSTPLYSNILTVVLVNVPYYAGTTYLWFDKSNRKDYGEGWSISYIGLPSIEKMGHLVRHEVNGHGFAKLADEYGHKEPDSLSIQTLEAVLSQYELMGYYKNIDNTADSMHIKWSSFLYDSDYASECLGAYAGGLTLSSYFYRPTDTSIMKNNSGEFNAPSRQAIYHRMHKLSYGDAWQYDHDDFKKYDLSRHAPAIDTGIKPITRFDVDDADFPLLPSPVIEMIDVSSYIRR